MCAVLPDLDRKAHLRKEIKRGEEEEEEEEWKVSSALKPYARPAARSVQLEKIGGNLSDFPNEPEQGLRLAIHKIIHGQPGNAATNGLARVQTQIPVLLLQYK